MWPRTVTKDDLIIETKRGAGKGGQNKNKRDTAVRMVHIPTGIEANAEDQRTQGQNIKIAFRRLADKLVPLMREAATAKRPESNTNLVRSYKERGRIVLDERIDKVFDYTKVLFKDGLNDIIEELVKEKESCTSKTE